MVSPKHGIDVMSLTVTGLILSLAMKDTLIRLKVLLVIIVVKKKVFVFTLSSLSPPQLFITWFDYFYDI